MRAVLLLALLSLACSREFGEAREAVRSELGAVCARDGDCATGHCSDATCCERACDASERCNSPEARGSCVVRPLGSSCADDGQCGTGHCVDGSCCERACGACEVCDAFGREGRCTPAPDGSNLRNQLAACFVCRDGIESPAVAATNPRNDCKAGQTCGYAADAVAPHCLTQLGFSCRIDSDCAVGTCLGGSCAGPRAFSLRVPELTDFNRITPAAIAQAGNEIAVVVGAEQVRPGPARTASTLAYTRLLLLLRGTEAPVTVPLPIGLDADQTLRAELVRLPGAWLVLMGEPPWNGEGQPSPADGLHSVLVRDGSRSATAISLLPKQPRAERMAARLLADGSVRIAILSPERWDVVSLRPDGTVRPESGALLASHYEASIVWGRDTPWFITGTEDRLLTVAGPRLPTPVVLQAPTLSPRAADDESDPPTCDWAIPLDHEGNDEATLQFPLLCDDGRFRGAMAHLPVASLADGATLDFEGSSPPRQSFLLRLSSIGGGTWVVGDDISELAVWTGVDQRRFPIGWLTRGLALTALHSTSERTPGLVALGTERQEQSSTQTSEIVSGTAPLLFFQVAFTPIPN